MPQAPKSVETIYNGAVLLRSAAEQAAYLDSVCGREAELRQRVEALLRSHEDSAIEAAEPSPTVVVSHHSVLGERAGDTIGHYKLVQALGEGGFGTVYLAEQSQPVRRQVALKIIKVGMDTREVMGRFETERQALALMDHPNIAKVFDAGATETGRPFFVMEWVRGVPITQYGDEFRLTTEDRLALFMTVCEAVQHAHQKGVIHRDIKPSNILVTAQGGRPAPKVIDFGIAKATQQRLTDSTVVTHAQQFIGTPAYMSPEQAGSSGLDIDTRSDIYSLGVLLYELLTGHTPFESKDLLGAGYDDLRKNIREKDPPKPSTRLSALTEDERTTVARRRRTESAHLTTTLRRDLDWIVMKALEKDRARRYESATAFADDLRRYLNHEPVTAAAPSTTYRFRKFARRNRGVLAAAAAVTTALILGTVFSVWQAILANQQTSVANQATAEAEKQEAIAVEQQAKATSAERQTRETFSRSDFQIADELLERNRDAQAVAHLTRALRSDPDNHAAAARLLMTLARGNVISPPIIVRFPGDQDILHQGPGRGTGSTVSSDGSLMVMARAQEAHVFDGSTGTALGSPLPLTATVSSLIVTPDNRQLIVGMTNGVAEVWDIRTRQLTDKKFSADPPSLGPPLAPGAPVPPPPPGRIGGDVGFPDIRALNCTVHLSADGQKLALFSAPEDMRGFVSVGVRDFAGGELLATIATGQPLGPVVRFAHDGSWLAVTGQNGGTNGVFVQNLIDQSSRFLPVGTRVMDIAITPDDSRLITASADPIIRIWDVVTGEIVAQHKGHVDAIRHVRLNPAGTRLILNSGDSTVRVLDPITGRELSPPLEHSQGSNRARQGTDPSLLLQTLGVSPDGMKVATAAHRQLRVWSLITGELLAGPVESDAGVGSQGQFSQDGSRLMVHSGETVEIWAMTTPAALPTRLHQEGFVSAQAIAPDGLRIATALGDRTVRIWEPGTGRELTAPLLHPANVSLLAVNATSLTLAAVADTTVHVWDLNSGMLRATMKSDFTVRELALSKTGNRILVKGSEFSRKQGAVMTDWHIWDAAQGTTLFSKQTRGFDGGNVKMSADGSRVGVAESDGVTVTDLTTLMPVGPRIRNQSLAALNADGSRVVTVARDESGAQTWDAATATEIGIAIPLRRGMTDAKFTPDGTRLLVLDAERRVSIYEVATGRLANQPIRLGEAGAMEDISEDSRFLLTSQVAASGRSSRVWEIATGSALTHELEPGYQRFVHGGRRLASALPDPRLFDLPFGDLHLPGWFLDFAEAFAGQRFNADGLLEPVAGTERVRLEREIEGKTDTGEFAQWARWMASDPGRRANSPFSPLSLDALVANTKPVNDARAEDAWGGVLIAARKTAVPSTAELRRVLAQHPLHPRAMAEYGTQLSGMSDEVSQTEADWYTRRAAELAPDSAAVCQRRAEFLSSRKRNEAALAALNPGLHADPANSSLRLLQGRIFFRLERLPEADAALTAVIDRRDFTKLAHRTVREQALRERVRVRRAQGRAEAAQHDFMDAKGIPRRGAEAAAELVDLSSFYNAGFDETRLPLFAGRPFEPMVYEWVGGNDLSPLPRGRLEFGGVTFDVRGLVQLSSSLLEANAPGKWPSTVKAIPIGRKARRLHLLLGVGTSRRMIAENDPSATFSRIAGMLPPVLLNQEVARLRMSYGDGSTRDFPLRLGPDIRDVRLFHRDEAQMLNALPEHVNSPTVWTGVNPAGVRLALGRLSLGHDHPARRIETLDFISAMKEGSPFLLAITVEPVSTDPAVWREEVRKLVGEGTLESISTASELSLDETAALITDELRSNPDDPSAWLHQGFLRVGEGTLHSAVESFARAVASSGADPARAVVRVQAARYLTETLRQMGRIDEARRTNLLSFGIPERPAEATAAQIDLSLHYNGALTNSWMTPGNPRRNDLSNLSPLGIKTLGDVPFDVRGVVQLAGARMVPTNIFPVRAEGIQIAARCGKIHFLHAAGWGDGPPGLPIGHYQVHYSDGRETRIDLKVEEDLLDWWSYPNRRRETRKSEVVWTGENEYSRTFDAGVRLFKTTWTNPHPESEIATIDFASAMNPPAPFLIAMTAE